MRTMALVFAQRSGFDGEIVDAGWLDVLDVGGELGGAGGERGTLFAQSFGLVRAALRSFASSSAVTVRSACASSVRARALRRAHGRESR